MGTYDWMELQTLTNDIAAARTRLAAARATKDVGKARGLEEEIARAEAQRDRLLTHITTNLVSASDPPSPKGAKGAAAALAVEPTPPPAAVAQEVAPAPIEATPVAAAENVEAAAPPVELAPVQQEEAAAEAAGLASGEESVTEQHPPNIEDRVVATGATPPAPAPQAASAEGGRNMWEQLKPSDIENAKQNLKTRRSEMLARHAEELRGLEADQSQLEILEQAIAAFMQKFTSPPGGAGVVKLDAERELRQTAG